MLLSNLFTVRSCILLPVVLIASCGWFESGPDLPPPASTAPASDLPFAAKEPETYSADLFLISGDIETRRSFARKGEKWRLDIFEGDVPSTTAIQAGARFLIDHRGRRYAETVTPAGGADPDFIQDLTVEKLRERRYTRFEDLGLQGGLRRYRATIGDRGESSVLLYFDESLRIVVKQEFGSGEGQVSNPLFRIELRNITLEVPESAFAVPEGYRKVSEKEYFAAKE